MLPENGPPENGCASQQPLQHEELLARCLGNLEFAERVLSTFQDRFEEDLAVLEQHCHANETDNIASLAHRMKGASANAAAPGLQAETARLEELARSQRADELPRQMTQLKNEWTRFTQSVTSLKSCSASPA